MNENELLTEAVKLGMINLDSVYDNIMANRKQQVLKMHKYSITQSTDGRWQTMYKMSDGKRKNVKAQTYEEVIDKLVKLYFTDTHIDNLTFYDVYTEWLEYKRTITSSANTIKRHGQHYRKYFESSKLHSMKFKDIDKLTLTSVCNQLIMTNGLSRTEWGNIKAILNGMWEFAVDKKYIKENVMKQVKLTAKCKQPEKKSGKTETYNTEELPALNAYLDQKIEETGDSSFYAVRFNFYAGLRVGELVALKWDDLGDTEIHVTREEVRNQETNVYSVVDHTKTYQDRYVTLVPTALELLSKVERQGEYIFMRNGERLTSRQIAYVLEKYAERQAIENKSTHKMRKTFASRLASNGMPLDEIREQLGHNNLNTTLGYIYNPLTKKQTYDLMVKALS